MRHALAITVMLVLTLAAARPDQLYLRNQPVKGQQRAGETYVLQPELERLLRPQDLNRITYEPPNVLVDGKVVGQLVTGQEPEIPLLAVTQALGYQKRANPALGFTDLVSPEAQQEKKKIEKRPGGGEWATAQANMQRALAQEGGVFQWPEQLERIQRIGDLLSERTEAPSLQWNYYIVNQEEPNAFCTGAGALAISRGLLQLNLTDDELAGVIAHEIGHGMCRHSENAAFRAGQMNSLEGGMERLRAEQSSVASKLRALYARQDSLQSSYRKAQAYYQQTGDSSLMAEVQQEMSSLNRQIRELENRYTRLENELQRMAKSWKDKDYRNNSKLWNQGDELDADTRGLRYATAAGYKPEGLLMALLKLRKARVEKFGWSALAGEGSGSHPPVSTRIQIADKVLTDWKRSGR